ncbi:MAG: peptidoglycan bridge formation glycyltransferase FemA/FemB family protein [Firmicutes bacterium]|jgi:lipid II:glycine glycyltransferase (peptidoglycan interpeptide bridge formation enzyme)|nr:peptidoglycan bridge formation glycyltransferase FemA/FemB family protein [Bacillota bacterium]
MHFRLIAENESARLDDFLRSTPNGHIFQSYCWGEVKKTEWQPLRLIGETESGEIVAAATVLKRRIPALRKSFFYLPRGPILKDWSNREHFTRLMDFLKSLAAEHKAIFIKIDPCIRESEFEPVRLLAEAGFRRVGMDHGFGGLQPRYTFRLDISKDLDGIMSAFNHKLRYKIRFAYKKGITFVRPGREEGLKGFMKIMQETADRGEFVIREPFYYDRVYQNLAPQGSAVYILGYYQGELITAALAFAFGDKAWGMYSGQANVYRNIYAYHALIWEQIKWAKERGANCFDFYGVPGEVDESHPLYGIYHFKKSFGGELYTFVGEMDLVLSPFYYFFWTRLFPLYRNLLLWVTRMLRRGRRSTAGEGSSPLSMTS